MTYYMDISVNLNVTNGYDYGSSFYLHMVQKTYPPSPTIAKAFLCLSYCLMILVCGIGNILFCLVIIRFRRMRTTTNVLIGNLVASDFMVAVLCVPFSFFYVLQDNWPFGEVMCMLVASLKMASFYVSINSLLVITIDRFIIIMHPLKPRITKMTTCFVLAGIWLVSAGIVVPTTIQISVEDFADGSIRCLEMSYSKVLKAYTIVLFVLEFIVPLLVMSVCYFLIARKLWFRRVGQVTEEQAIAAEVSKRRTIRMLISVVSIFAICWAPYHIFAVVRDVFMPSYHSVYQHLFSTIYLLSEALAMLNSMFNTLIYVVFNSNFRKHVLQLPESFRSKQKQKLKKTGYYHPLSRRTISQGRGSSTRSSQLRTSILIQMAERSKDS